MTPQLRFPDFTDEWAASTLGDISEYSKQRIEASKLDDDNFVGVDSLISNLGGKLNSQHTPTTGKVTGFVKGDILHSNIRPYLKKAWLADIEGGVSADVLVIHPKDGDVDSNFLYHQITSDKYFDYVVSGSKGVKMPRGDKAHIMDYEIAKPDIDEQQKIADFLGAVDDKLTSTQNKVAAMHEYKKGVMQALFSGKLRFKDKNGDDYPVWQERKVSDFMKERKEYAPKDGSYEHISLTTAGVVPKSERYERDFLVGSEDKKYRITRVDDICYNPANLKFGVIARNKYKDGIFSPIYITYEVEDADVAFVEYMVTRSDFIQFARKFEEGTVYERMAVSPKDLATLVVEMPSIKEQQKIADFLSALDDKIKLEEAKLASSKEFKKALLQRMFV